MRTPVGDVFRRRSPSLNRLVITLAEVERRLPSLFLGAEKADVCVCVTEPPDFLQNGGLDELISTIHSHFYDVVHDLPIDDFVPDENVLECYEICLAGRQDIEYL